jgi:hypothetical protein
MIDHVDGVRLRLLTASKGPIFYPPVDIYEYEKWWNDIDRGKLTLAILTIVF